MKPVKFNISFLFLTIFLSGCNFSPASKVDPFDIGNARTYYESLDLDTPESTARTFINAFQRFDFPTVFMILSSESQSDWGWTFVVNRSQLFRDNIVPFLDEEYMATNINSEQYWSLNMHETEVAFELFMMAAKEAHKLWIDLSGEVSIIGSEKSQTLEGEDAVDVTCMVEGFEEPVIVRIVRDTTNDDWRVFQVIAPGGNEEITPWSYNSNSPQAFVHSKATFSGNPESPRTYYESLNLFTPEEAVSTFLEAYKQENYTAIWLIFSIQAQEAWYDQFATLQPTLYYGAPEYWWGQNCGSFDSFLHDTSKGSLFDLMMLFGKDCDILPFNIRGRVNVNRTEETLTGLGENAVDVYTKIDGIEGEVIFRLTETTSGRWRVHQVIFPGGDEEIIPWSHPPN